jgi:hypothetical protein
MATQNKKKGSLIAAMMFITIPWLLLTPLLIDIHNKTDLIVYGIIYVWLMTVILYKSFVTGQYYSRLEFILGVIFYIFAVGFVVKFNWWS